MHAVRVVHAVIVVRAVRVVRAVHVFRLGSQIVHSLRLCHMVDTPRAIPS